MEWFSGTINKVVQIGDLSPYSTKKGTVQINHLFAYNPLLAVLTVMRSFGITSDVVSYTMVVDSLCKLRYLLCYSQKKGEDAPQQQVRSPSKTDVKSSTKNHSQPDT